MPPGHGARRADAGMHLVGPHIGALQGVGGVCQGLVHQALIRHLARCAGVAANRVFKVMGAGHAGPRFPMHLQFAHGLFGVFFAFGHHADKIALHHHRVDAGDVGNGRCFHPVQGVANESTAVGARIGWSHDPAMQHAGHAHIVDIDQIRKHLGGDVHTRQALTHPLMVIRWCQLGVGLQGQIDRLVFEQGCPRQAAVWGTEDFTVLKLHLAWGQGPALGGLSDQPLAGLRRRSSQRRGMDLNRGAGNRGPLVGRHRGHTHQDMDFGRIGVKFFSHQLGQGGAQTGAQIHMAMQSGDAAVVPHGQQTFIALAGVAVDKGRLARRWGLLGQGGATNAQDALRFKQISALVNLLGTHGVRPGWDASAAQPV